MAGQRPTFVPSGILIQPAVWPDTGQNSGGGSCAPLLGAGGAGSSPITMWPGTRPTSTPSGILIHSAIWPQQIWAENWGTALWGRGVGSPSNTMCLGPEPPCMPSFILIRPNIWPQCTNVTDIRQTDRQRTDSVGRTVLQTVAQKLATTHLRVGKDRPTDVNG